MNKEFLDKVNLICQKDNRYKVEGYAFVMEALSFTQNKNRVRRHITGEELLKGIKDLSLEQFGPLAKMVLNFWGIKETADFGNIVFNLVDLKVLSKTDQDDIAHFKDGFDFEKVFKQDYRERLNQQISKMRAI